MHDFHVPNLLEKSSLGKLSIMRGWKRNMDREKYEVAPTLSLAWKISIEGEVRTISMGFLHALLCPMPLERPTCALGDEVLRLDDSDAAAACG